MTNATRGRFLGLATVVTVAALAGAACGGSSDSSEPGTTAAPATTPPAETMPAETGTPAETTGETSAAAAPTSDTPSAQLRATLNTLLAEHVILASDATGAALGGRMDEFDAAAGALDANSVALADAIGSVYGPDAQEAFLGLWRSHIGMVVDYTTGLATGDQAKADKAVNDLLGYATAFGQALSGLNENLPADTVEELVKMHILTLKDVIDAQAAGKPQKAYEAVLTAVEHMHMIGDPLAAATAAKFPDQFADPTDTPAATLRSGLNVLLAEHVFLASDATNAALGGRQKEFKAAAGALDANSVALADAIGSVYGPDAQEAFLGLWRSHIGMVVDYTTGLATGDQAKADKAVNDLLGYATAFGQALSGLNENLPADTVEELVKMHILTLKDVIDAQAAGDQAKAYSAARVAASHMHMVADPLTEATVVKFADQFAS